MTCSASRSVSKSPADLIADLEAALDRASPPVSDLAAQVTAALERSILPSVIARGAAAIRVAAADEDGVITLEVPGSPGAVLPVLGRIEAQIRAAVPGVTAVRLAAPAGPAESPPEAGDLGGAAQRILDAEVNPAIAAHRGHVDRRQRRRRLDPHPPRGRLPGLQPGRGDHPAGHRAAAARPAARHDRRGRRHRP